MEAKLKHLEFIQAAISRMATNSFLFKGWAINDLALAILVEPGPETPQRIEQVRQAFARGADPNRSFEEILKKYDSESDVPGP